MSGYLASRPLLVLGYHGCDKRIGQAILNGNEMVPANNGYDWLGTGYYFWEGDPVRAMEWAVEAKKRHEAEKRVSDKSVRDPYVIGAVLDLGKCLDLTTVQNVQLVKLGYRSFVKDTKAAGRNLPKNIGGKEMKGRYLDCAVINYTCLKYLESKGKDEEFDSVRALFIEGKSLYPNAGFRDKTHTQICIRERSWILGFFRIKQPVVAIL